MVILLFIICTTDVQYQLGPASQWDLVASDLVPTPFVYIVLTWCTSLNKRVLLNYHKITGTQKT